MTEIDTTDAVGVEIDGVVDEIVMSTADYANLLAAALSTPTIPTPAMLELWSTLNDYNPHLARRAYRQAWNASAPRDRLAALIVGATVPDLTEGVST